MNLKDGIYSGSGRSVGDINILEILKELQEKGLVKNVGGHKGALGIDIEKNKLNDFYIELMKIINDENRFPESKFIDKKKPNFYISFSNLTIFDIDLYKHLEKWEPFGHRFPKPNFATIGKISSLRQIGKNKNHALINITDENNLVFMKGMWFFYDENIFKNLKTDKEYIIIWIPDIDNWGGQEKLSLRILTILDLDDLK
jgi:single-stranded DNA-specific DHH superfamily exonuclease